jgi:hypothetical protein
MTVGLLYIYCYIITAGAVLEFWAYRLITLNVRKFVLPCCRWRVRKFGDRRNAWSRSTLLECKYCIGLRWTIGNGRIEEMRNGARNSLLANFEKRWTEGTINYSINLGIIDKKKEKKKKTFWGKKRDCVGKCVNRCQKQPPKNPTPQVLCKIFCGTLKPPILVFGLYLRKKEF